MYDYSSFTYEDSKSKFGEAPLIKRTSDTPQSIVYAYNGIQEVAFEAFSNSTFGEDQVSIYMSENGIDYDLIDAKITKIGIAPGSSDFSKYSITASVDTDKYNFVKFEVKNDSKIFNPMIAKAEIAYNYPYGEATDLNVLDKRINVNVGKDIQINTKLAPLDATKQLQYESANPEIATVNQDGVVTGVSIGTTVITVRLNDEKYIKVPVNVYTENYALNKPATATSVKAGQPELAVDGNYSTRWGSKEGTTVTDSITVDMEKVQTIDTIKIFWENARALDYDIEVAGEDQEFKVIKEMRGISGTYNDVINFESTQARYVRISGKKPVSKYGYSIYELEIYNNSSIVDVASIDFDVDTTELYVGQEVDLAVKVSPENATYPLPVYTSSNEDIIKIVNGKMIARKAGNVVITAEADGQTTTMNIKVVDENKFKIANELDTLVIKNGKIQFPTSDRYKFIIESSSHEKVIGLDGVVHTPINDTSVDIVVRVEDKENDDSRVALTKPITLNVKGDEKLLTVLLQKTEEAKNLDKDLYKPSTLEKVTKALDKAEKIIKVDDLLVSEVNEALTNLNKGIEGLELKEDRSILNKQLEVLKNLDKELYTQSSYQNMLDTISKIERNINDDSSKKDIEKAIDQLNKANAMLVKQSDYDLLSQKVEELKDMDLSMYTTASIKDLKEALEKAETYLNDDSITTQGLYDYYVLVLDAYNQLELRGDKTALEAYIAKIEKEDLSSYTSKSVNDLNKVLNDIKKKIKNNLTDKEYTALMQQLQKAYNALEKKETVKITQDETINSNVLGDTVDNVKTGDATLLMPYAILALCAAGVYVVIKKKRV